MKRRSGFVSNSSSSSFIASLNSFSSTLDIAIAMIPFRDYEDDQKLIEKAKQLSGVSPPNIPITFSSTNYKTYIYTMNLENGEEVYAIKTCNNHPFREVEGFRDTSDELIEKMDSEELHCRQTYYNIELDLSYKEIPYDCQKISKNMCNKHFCYEVILAGGLNEGKTVCPICYKEKCSRKEKEENVLRSIFDIINFNNLNEIDQLLCLLKNAINVGRKLKFETDDNKINAYNETIENAIRDIAMGLTGSSIGLEKEKRKLDLGL